MESLFTFAAPPGTCTYRPDQTSSLFYEVVGDLTPAEYQSRLLAGWRRFGFSLFRPKCPSCRRCQSLRVPVVGFRPDRSQRRADASNLGDVSLHIGPPFVSSEKLELYDRFHEHQHHAKGWPSHDLETAEAYLDSFVENPFPTEEWCYRLGEKLVGVGYVDALPDGLSAIYFYHDPAERDRSLGTFNVLSIIREAANRGLPHVYLGYYVEGCRSLEYKARFRPNEVLVPDGAWQPFL